MISYQKQLIVLFDRLLVDISFKARLHLEAPVEISNEWLLIEAPLLDKQMLQSVEGQAEWPVFPWWLTPLSDRVRLLTLSDLELGRPCKEAALNLGWLHQVLVFCYKTEYCYTNEQQNQATRAFVETDSMVGVWERSFAELVHRYTYGTARRIVSSVTDRIDWSKARGFHGPGGVYPSRRPEEKSSFETCYESIASHYPLDSHFFLLPSFWHQELVEKDGRLKVGTNIVAKLTAVPKDSRGPRLICVHPTESIWIQQGQRRLLESAIASHRLTRGRISFTDQTVNGKLALQSSLTREYTTLDLKEASDRVSCSLVRYLFGETAYDWLSCSRATHVKLPDGSVVTLRKWAPMGNALCFPVESLIFFALAVSGIRSHYGVNCSEVYVFGDDIVFPTRYYDGVLRTLCSAGLVPNASKTFRNGFYRESCGVEAYGGFDITPLRLRQPDSLPLKGLVSHLDLAKRARLGGYESLASHLYSQAIRFHGRLPLCNNPKSGGLVEYVRTDMLHLILHEKNCSFHKESQCWVVHHKSISPSILRPEGGDWYLLMDALNALDRVGQSSYNDECHCRISDRGLEYPIPRRVRLTRGWTPLLY